VHAAARVAARAEAGLVLASSTVRDLVAGSGLEFEDRGSVELKGVGSWTLYEVC
jgi:class 3 adenylate cyclase